MQQSLCFSFSLLLVLLHFTNTFAQAPAQSPSATVAKAPAGSAPPSGPTDSIPILLKAGRFLTFIRLIKATHVDTQLFSQVNSSTDGITMFAPNDKAFSNLKAGAVESLNYREQVEFVQFHILPRFLSGSDFQTLSNPVRTLAGSSSKFPLTITSTDNSVTIDSGVTKTSIANTIYKDKQVAIYEVNKVLIPKNVFPPAPAPAPAKPKTAESPVAPKDASGAINFGLQYNAALFAVGIVAGVLSL